MTQPDLLNHYTAGDQIVVRAQLLLNRAPDTLTGATVTAALSLPDRSAKALGTSAVECTIVDSPTATVEAVWPAAQTANIVPGRYLVEFRSVISGVPVTYERGEILVEKGVL